MSAERRFPIMDSTDGRASRPVKWHVPWALLAAHEAQAFANHCQSLEALASRGGLAPCEALAVIEDRRWQRMDKVEARKRLKALAEPKPAPAEAAVQAARDEEKKDVEWAVARMDKAMHETTALRQERDALATQSHVLATAIGEATGLLWKGDVEAARLVLEKRMQAMRDADDVGAGKGVG